MLRFDNKQILVGLLATIPPVPCDGCCDCCDGIAPGSLPCTYLINGKCIVRANRPLDCRLYGAVEGRPCIHGKISANPLTADAAAQIASMFTALTGKDRHSPI